MLCLLFSLGSSPWAFIRKRLGIRHEEAKGKVRQLPCLRIQRDIEDEQHSMLVEVSWA